MAFVENESAGYSIKTLLVDAIDDFNAARVELRQHGGDRLYVFLLRYFTGDRDGHGRAAKGHKVRSFRRLNHDVRADTFNALGRFRKQAAGEADDNDDEGDLHSDG